MTRHGLCLIGCLMTLVASASVAGDDYLNGGPRADCNNNGVEDSLEIGPFYGSALDFDGTEDFVQIQGSDTGGLAELGEGDFTIEAWVRTTDVGRSILIGNYAGPPFWNLELHQSPEPGSLRLCFENSVFEDYRSSITVADGQWHHVAAVRTMGPGGSVQLYIDGNPLFDPPLASENGPFTVDGETLIGCDQRTSPPYFGGMLDEVRVWSVARTDAQIENNMYTAFDGTEPGLVAYWRLDDGPGTAASDETGSHDGTLMPTAQPAEWIPQSADCSDNGIPDDCEPGWDEDCNENGEPDLCDIWDSTSYDCNYNHVPDECDLADGTSEDCNENGRPDECDIEMGQANDCNENGIPDECDLATGFSPDCNGNNNPDECDLDIGFSEDCNYNGVPDECDIHVYATSEDCNENGRPDECDIIDGASADCNDNDIPDECEGDDCNGNERLDECDIVEGTSEDCNDNDVPDECDINDGTSNDCNWNGIPDECEGDDCNDNGQLDECDIVEGTSEDCNHNDVPDECDIIDGTSADCNFNDLPDECEPDVWPGFALEFDGQQDYVFLGTPTILTELGQGDFTLEMWVRTADDGRSVLIGNYADTPCWNLEIYSAEPAGHLRFYCHDGATAGDFRSDVSIADDTWHHVAAVRTLGENGRARLYIDGVLACNESCEVGPFALTNATYLARDTRSFPHYLDGMLDEVRMWNVARTSAEIAADAHRILDGSEPGLLAYWRFEEGSGNNTIDEVSGLPGSLGGPPDWVAHLPDCNDNGTSDLCDLDVGTSQDCNGNMAPDECEIGGLEDCNENGTPDLCDIHNGTSGDCNENAVPDECEPGGAEDCNDNSSPDLCDIYEETSQDCNENAVPDECDLSTGTSTDCNANDIPDDCDIANGTSQDCNANDIPDECETGGLEDCNTNGVPDLCDIFDGTSDDCNENGIPDDCELGWDEDCNDNGVPDLCDIYDGTSEDTNDSGIPDECETVHNLTQGTIHPTIQEAIDEANNGDEIEVGPARYVENLLLDGVTLTLRSRDGTETTIIDGNNAGRVITCMNTGPDMILEGFSITGGDTPEAGGGMCNIAASPTVRDCVFRNNMALRGGGMANQTGCNATITGCSFIDNVTHAEVDGGSGGGMYNYECSPTVSDCTFSGNVTAHSGGGMSNHGGSPTITDCTFAGNWANDYVLGLWALGGGMYNDSSSPSLSRCTFRENGVAVHTLSGNYSAGGGGVHSSGGSPAVVDCRFTKNSAIVNCRADHDSGDYAYILGGGLCQSAGALTISGCEFIQNKAKGMGDDGDCSGSDATVLAYGGGIGCEFYANVHVSTSSFIENAAVGVGYDEAFCTQDFVDIDVKGGGLSCSSSNVTVLNCLFAGNHATTCYLRGDGFDMYSLGGGIYSDGLGDLSATNCTFVGNTSSFDAGALYSADGSPLLTNCTFSGNVAEGVGGGLYSDAGSPTLVNCVLWGNTAPTTSQIYDDPGSSTAATFSCIQGDAVWPGAGNINTNPVFAITPDDGGDGWGDVYCTFDVDESENNDYGDLRVLTGSPCIDGADNTAVPADDWDLDDDGGTTEPVPFDLDGLPRFVDDPTVADTGVVHPDSPELPLVDMGAYEFQSTRVLGDLNCDQAVDILDIEPFVMALTDPAAYELAYPDCDSRLADLDDNATVDGLDVALFVELLTGG